MNKEELKSILSGLLPYAVADDTGEWLKIRLTLEDFLPAMETLRKEDSLHFDYMFCLTCVDWKTHLNMVYHLESTQYRHQLVINVQLNRANPEIETVCHIWRTAEFHEREVYEMFGVNFLNHPDLRLLILPEGWEGKKPMLKDFEDPVNMIKL